MPRIPVGKSHSQVFSPQAKDLASSVGNQGVDVVATTTLILYFEEVSANLVRPFISSSEVTVGTHVNVDHLAPANDKEKIWVNAVLTKCKGSRLEFELTAEQSNILIMKGHHHRAIMPESKFSQSLDGFAVAHKNTNMNQNEPIEFWFDFHSPWCYFASTQIGKIAREFNRTVSWKPIHLANLNKAIDGRRPLEANKNFVDWYEQDQRDTADLLNLTFDPHKAYPKRPSRALRAAIYADEHQLAEAFVTQIMQGYWSRQKDISDMDWLCQVGNRIGLNVDELRQSMTSEAFKQKLNDNLLEGISKNLFGLPTAISQRKLFWGNDRLQLLKHHLSANQT